MKCLKLLALVLVMACMGMAPAYAADRMADGDLQLTDKACWVEIFEDNNFDMDDPHVKVPGPKEYSSLKNLLGRDWNDDIESLVIGPNATVKAFSKKDFAGTEVAFTPNQRVPELSKLDMSNEIESMKITCGKP